MEIKKRISRIERCGSDENFIFLEVFLSREGATTFILSRETCKILIKNLEEELENQKRKWNFERR